MGKVTGLVVTKIEKMKTQEWFGMTHDKRLKPQGVRG